MSEGIDELERLVGVRAVVGGRHPGRGTENALVSLGGGTYLEIIAPQHEAALSPHDERMRRLDHLRIIDWAISVEDVPAAITALNDAGFAATPLQSGARVTPAGERLEWTTFRIADGSLAVAPFFINWSAATKHPATTAPPGCALARLVVQDPKADRLSAALGALGVHGVTYASGAPRIDATLTCGARTVTVTSP